MVDEPVVVELVVVELVVVELVVVELVVVELVVSDCAPAGVQAGAAIHTAPAAARLSRSTPPKRPSPAGTSTHAQPPPSGRLRPCRLGQLFVIRSGLLHGEGVSAAAQAVATLRRASWASALGGPWLLFANVHRPGRHGGEP